MTTQHLHVYERPQLTDARMLLGFTGWMDGGDVSTGVIQYLVDSLGAERIAEILPGHFYIYNMPGSMEVAALFRPYVQIEDGLITAYREPDNAFYCDPKRNLLLFSGKEPNLHWAEFADCILTFAESLGVSMIQFVGSVAGLVPHTREPRFYGSVSDPELLHWLIDHEIVPSSYEGPASFVTYLTTRAQDRGLNLTTLVAGIPTYVEGRNTMCIKSTLRRLSGMLALNLDLSELQQESDAFERQLNETIQERPELAEQIRKIETFFDQETLGSQEDNLKTWFEKQGFRLDL